MDSYAWQKPVGKARRTITIADKLKVVEFWQKRKQERIEEARAKVKANEAEQNRSSEQEIVRVKAAARKAKKVNLKGLEKECRAEFPDIVGQSRVAKWVRAASDEQWSEIPSAIRARTCTTSNTWRVKLGLPVRGRREGGSVPLSLQKELDYLVMEHAAGQSEVTERREVVTPEHVVSWLLKA